MIALIQVMVKTTINIESWERSDEEHEKTFMLPIFKDQTTSSNWNKTGT